MRTRVIVVVAALVGAIALVAAPPAAVAVPTPPPITATLLPTPAGGSNVVTTSIACAGAGFCVAVGNYVVSPTQEGVIETLSNGTWTALQAPLPPNATATPGVALAKVACGAAGSCVAYGSYAGNDAKQHTVLLSLASGTWSAQELVLPADADTSKLFSVKDVACAAANSCVVVGDYTATDNLGHSFATTFHGSWSSLTVSLPGDHVDFGTASGAVSNLRAVSCGTSLCIAVGRYSVSDGTGRGLASAINPVAPTVNSTQAPMGSNIMAFGDLSSVSCAKSGPCAAYGSYDDTGSHFHDVFVPLNGASWSAIDVPTLTASTIPPIVVGLGCVNSATGADCVAGGLYDDPSTHYLVDRLTSNAWGAVNGSFPSAVTSFDCGSSTFCVGVTQGGPQNAITAFSGGDWTVQDAPNPPGQFPPTTNGVFGVSCDAPTSCWIIGTTTGTVTGGLALHVGTSVAPPPPPSISLTGPTAPFTLGSSTKVSWTASSTAGLAGFQVRYRKASWNGGFGAWQTAWPSVAGSARSVTVTGLTRGTDYCYEARAEDTSSTWSAWTSQRCTAVPLDDRAVSTGLHWTRAKGSAYWNSTVTTSTRLGAIMSRTSAQLDRIAIVATRCASCGRIKMYVGSALIGTVNLTATHTIRRAVIVLPAFSLRSGTVRIKVITSGRSVQIDGLGIARS